MTSSCSTPFCLIGMGRRCRFEKDEKQCSGLHHKLLISLKSQSQSWANMIDLMLIEVERGPAFPCAAVPSFPGVQARLARTCSRCDSNTLWHPKSKVLTLLTSLRDENVLVPPW